MIARLAATCVLAVGLGASTGASAGSDDIAFVLLGEHGAAMVHVITTDAACPVLKVDGARRPMSIRAPAATEPLRPTASAPDLSKPSAFPALTCEARLPARATSASVGGRRIPVPKARVDRIVVIGDTGCRLKASDDAYQACNDPRAYPFATVAARAAAWKPDLIVHVGDMIYRANPCPDGNQGCAGSPWGYGLDAWRADFFDPAAPLLRAAPWVATRGNHETCDRAGQGWWRFMDPRPLRPGRDCDDPAKDVAGDYSPPYAVPLGGGVQIVNMDLSSSGNKPFAPTDPRAAQFRDTYDRMAALAARTRQTIALDHFPILGVAAKRKDDVVSLDPRTRAIQTVFGQANPALAPKGVDILLAGHVHLWEQASFGPGFPTQFIAGFSGTEEDAVPLPPSLPKDFEVAPGARVEAFSSWTDGFGYMTLERGARGVWKATIWNTSGRAVNRCEIVGRRSKCERPTVTNGG